jgi:hypothetical protein
MQLPRIYMEGTNHEPSPLQKLRLSRWSEMNGALSWHGLALRNENAIQSPDLWFPATGPARLDHKQLQCVSNPAVEVASEGVKWRLILLNFNPQFFSCIATEEKAQVEEQMDLLVVEISRHSLKDPMISSSAKSRLRYRVTLIQRHDEYLNAYLDGDGFVGYKVRLTYWQ